MVFDFVHANKILDKEKAIHPNNRVSDYIGSYILFWNAALNEDADDMDKYEDEIDDVIDLIEDDEEESPYRKFFLSDIYLRGAYLKAMQTSYMSAAYRFNKAYNLVQENKKEYPQFIPNKKLVGLMNVGIGTVPKKYTWVLKLFNFEGNVKDGMQELEQLLSIASINSNYHYLLSESLLLYSFSAQNFEVSKSSIQNLLQIFNWPIIKKELPENQFMIFAKAEFLKHIKHTDEAINCIKGERKTYGAMRLYYLDYLLGQCLITKLDYAASQYFIKYLNEYNGSSYWRSAKQKLAWTYLLQGNFSLYKSTIKTVLNSGNDNRDSDRQATKEAERGIAPNTSLLKARLLFDGGYYDRAIRILQSTNTSGFSMRNQLEYTYRLGRIYDKMENTSLAISYYNKCIDKGEDEEYYFAANAALQLGYIYERQTKYAAAKQMFERCLDMDYEEYQDGISQKAKAALERVENKS